jgi:plasmid stabilization system protein ParE
MTLPQAFHIAVRDEIDTTYAWYEGQRPGLGEEFLKQLQVVLDRVAESPELFGTVHEDIRAATLRRFPYVVYFRLEAVRIYVVAVQHGRRHPRRWQSRE